MDTHIGVLIPPTPTPSCLRSSSYSNIPQFFVSNFDPSSRHRFRILPFKRISAVSVMLLTSRTADGGFRTGSQMAPEVDRAVGDVRRRAENNVSLRGCRRLSDARIVQWLASQLASALN